MIADTLRTFLTRQPFEAFKLTTSMGKVLEFRHPAMVALAKTGVILLHADADGSPSDRWEVISYLHVVSIETSTGTVAA